MFQAPASGWQGLRGASRRMAPSRFDVNVGSQRLFDDSSGLIEVELSFAVFLQVWFLLNSVAMVSASGHSTRCKHKA